MNKTREWVNFTLPLLLLLIHLLIHCNVLISNAQETPAMVCKEEGGLSAGG